MVIAVILEIHLILVLMVINKYREYFNKRINEDDEFRKHIWELKGKILGCFCVSLSCHGEIIKEWLDSKDHLLV